MIAPASDCQISAARLSRGVAVTGIVAAGFAVVAGVALCLSGDTLHGHTFAVIAVQIALGGILLTLALLARRQSRKLAFSEKRFGRFFEYDADPILIIDPRGRRLVDANQRAVELFSQSAEELMQLPADDLFAEGAHALDEVLDAVRKEGASWHEQVRCRHSDGSEIWMEATGSMSPNQNSLVLLRLRDVNERLRIDHAIQSLAKSPSEIGGDDFCRHCVRDLATTCRSKLAFVGLFTDKTRSTMHTLAVWNGDDFGENFTYELAGSPCEDVISGCLRLMPQGVQTRYPRDEGLARLGIESYLGLTLSNREGQAIGVVVVADDKPMPRSRVQESLIEVYAQRVSLELERAQALRDAQQSDLNYRELIDGSAQGILIHRDWQPLYTNRQCLRIFGYESMEDFQSVVSLEELFDPADLPMLERYRIARMRGEAAPEHYEVRARRRDGTPIVLHSVVRLVEWNSRPAIQSSVLDVTDRKSAEAALRESEENFRRLAEVSREGILIHRMFKPLYVNRALGALLGRHTDELLALESIEKLFAPEERARIAKYGQARADDSDLPTIFTARMHHLDGRHLHVQIRTTATSWNGEPVVQATMIDVTEQREAEWILQSLHEFSAQQDLHFDARVGALLEAGCAYFNLSLGILSHIQGDEFHVINAVTPDGGLASGDVLDLDDTFCRETVNRGEPLILGDVLDHGLGEHRCFHKFALRTYVGIPLRVRGKIYGTLVFADAKPRQSDFTRTEKRILDLMGRWVAAETHRRLAEEDRIASEQRFRDYAETSADWFWETDEKMRFKYMQGRWQEVTGIASDQILGITRRELIERYVRDADQVLLRYDQIMGDRKPFRNVQVSWQRRLDDVRILANSGKPLFDEQGAFLGYRGAGRDVTEQVLAQEAVKHSETRFRDFASIAADWFWETDAELKLTYVSENHARITGRDDSDFLGKTRTEAFRGQPLQSDDWDAHIEATRRREPYSLTMETERADGSLLIIYIEGRPVLQEDGTFIGYRGIGREITEQIQAERELAKYRHTLEELVQERTCELENAQTELLQQERLATIGRLVATVSHELRNPLGAVRNAAYLLKRKSPDIEPRWHEQLEIINREINVADKIISDLLETTRAKLPLVRDFALRPLVEEVFDSCRSETPIRFHFECSPRDMWIAADADHLRQVLLNLVSNAAHAVSESGSIRVRADRFEDCNTIMVEDDGPGIPRQHAEQVFEPLFTTKSKGNGLGLWISREIVERHGGTLQIVNAEQRGTSMMITLPQEPKTSLFAAAG